MYHRSPLFLLPPCLPRDSFSADGDGAGDGSGGHVPGDSNGNSGR